MKQSDAILYERETDVEKGEWSKGLLGWVSFDESSQLSCEREYSLGLGLQERMWSNAKLNEQIDQSERIAYCVF